MINVMCSVAKTKQISILGYISGILAMIGLGIVSATMEDGREDDPWHIVGALGMFVGQSINILLFTDGLYRVRKYCKIHFSFFIFDFFFFFFKKKSMKC